MPMPRIRFTVRRLMAVVAVAAGMMGVLMPLLNAIDAANHGPHATEFNERCQELADGAGLVGRLESYVVEVLGKPTSVWKYWSATDLQTGQPAAGAHLITTYNFAPSFFMPCGKFQVHFAGGLVKSTEQLDD